MKGSTMNRRKFLQISGLAAAGTAAVASGAVLIAPDGGWAMSVHALDAHAAESLLIMARRLYPHDTLGDMYYAKVVEELDAKAGADPELGGLLKEGVGKLDNAMGVKWLDLSEGNQLAVLTGMEQTPFFQKVRSTTLVALYNNPLIWRHFGYEGPSFKEGGYIHRGFDDLSWLPTPPESASPKAG